MKLSRLADAIQPSATLAITSKAKQMRASGKDIISFAAGEPDFPPPEHVKQAAIDAVNANDSKYSPSPGLPELRAAIADKLKTENGVEYAPEQVIVTAGAKHALYNIMRVVLDAGDEALILSPYWVSYPEQVKACGATPVIVPTLPDFHPDIDKIKAAITPATRVIIINSPGNPTGSVFTAAELGAIAQLAVENDMLIISDEIYEKIIYDGNAHISVASISSEVSARTVTINGMSKAYAMPGWRVGYAAAANIEMIKAASRLQSQSTSNVCNIAQRAGIAALTGPQECLDIMRAEFDKRRIRITELANEIFGVQNTNPEGAFYLLADISPWLQKKWDAKPIENSFRFAEFLLADAEVAGVPGGAFGDDNYIRFSYATDLESIERGMAKIRNALTKLAD